MKRIKLSDYLNRKINHSLNGLSSLSSLIVIKLTRFKKVFSIIQKL